MRINVARTPAPIRLTAEQLRRRFSEETAAFRYTQTWSINEGRLTISITPRVYLRDDLRRGTAAYADAIRHEQQHERDFRGLLPRFRRQLRTRLRGVDPNSSAAASVVRNGLAWLAYQFCLTARAYHRRLGAMVPICQDRSNWG